MGVNEASCIKCFEFSGRVEKLYKSRSIQPFLLGWTDSILRIGIAPILNSITGLDIGGEPLNIYAADVTVQGRSSKA